eukprot:12071485-Alexandrium_andersonii.AAC.1
MSASLVGSEMCIRDSTMSVRWLALRALENTERRRAPPPAHSRARTCVPVSYTHLTLPTICSV